MRAVFVLLVGAFVGWDVRASGASHSDAAVAPFKKLTLAQLMDIEVTSVSRRPETLADVASAIQVVTSDDIRRVGATRLPDALRLISNLQVAQIDARQWAIAARGFNNTTTNKLLVQLDGRTLYTPLFAGVFWDVQDTLMDDADRIEVISGPGATQWGSNAVNGVINITTKHARDTQGSLIKGVVGTVHRVAGARQGTRIGPGAFVRVYGKYSDSNDSLAPTGLPGNDAWRLTQGGFRADWDRASRDRFTLQGDGYAGRIDTATANDIEVDGANLLARWSRTFAPQDDLSVQAYYDFTHRVIPNSIAEHLRIFDLDLHRSQPFGDHQLSWGGGFRAMDDRVRNAPGIAFYPADVKRNWYNAFVQDEVSLLANRLRLTAGIKVEHNPYTGAEVQPTVRAAWRGSAGQRWWGAISRAMRTPSRIDRELFLPADPPYTITGGPGFVSETLIASELGYRVEPRPGMALSLATFYHDYDDLRSLEPSLVAGGPSTIANGITGRSYGVEASLDYRPREGWRFRLGYLEQRVSSRTKPGSRDFTSIRSQVLDPGRQGVLNIQVDLSKRTSLDISLRYVGEIENQSVPAYTEADVRLSWRPKPEWELALIGRNLLDASHPEFGTAATRREVERNLNAAFTWRY